MLLLSLSNSANLKIKALIDPIATTSELAATVVAAVVVVMVVVLVVVVVVVVVVVEEEVVVVAEGKAVSDANTTLQLQPC
jgi:hypothetical protein